VAQKRNEIGGPMVGGKVGGREPRGFSDLLLTVAGTEESAAKLSRRGLQNRRRAAGAPAGH
jgi:hypothetical protein